MATVDYTTADGEGAGGAKAGSDYVATSGTLTFPARSKAARSIRVPVTDDGVYEAESETFTLTLRRPVNATLSGGGSVLHALGTIHDDDDGPPIADFELSGATCDEDLCRATTGTPVGFIDTSTGKVLSRLWEFGDGTTSRSRRVKHAWVEPGFYAVTLWAGDGTSESTASRKFLVEASEPAGNCEPTNETLCLHDSRYAVRVDWWSPDGREGPARVVHEGTNDSGLFAFFEPGGNWEILFKMLDGCQTNEHVWVYTASATTLGYSILASDTVTGETRTYTKELDDPAWATTDPTAFSDGCGP